MDPFWAKQQQHHFKVSAAGKYFCAGVCPQGGLKGPKATCISADLRMNVGLSCTTWRGTCQDTRDVLVEMTSQRTRNPVDQQIRLDLVRRGW